MAEDSEKSQPPPAEGDSTAPRPAGSVVGRPIQDAERSLVQVVTDVADKATLLIREEIELAKAETSAKLSKLGRGLAIFAAVAVFLGLATIFAFHTVAWALNQLVFNSFYLGYLVTTGLLVALSALGGLVAWRLVRAGSPPTPEMAIDEARITREALSQSVAGHGDGDVEAASAKEGT